MHQPPLPADTPILDRVLIWHIAIVTVLFLAAIYGIFNYALDQGYSLELARTLSVNMLIILEIFHLFYIRNIHTTSLTWEAVRGTRAVWICLLIVVVGQVLFTYSPFMQDVFDTRAVSLADGAILIAVGAAFFAIVEMEKQLRLRLSASTSLKK